MSGMPLRYLVQRTHFRWRYTWRGRWIDGRSRHPQVSLDSASETTGATLGDSLAARTPTPNECLEANERADEVRRAVAALPEELRQPFILAEYEECSHAEAGAILGCSAKAVETRLYRARQRLRASLGHLLEPA